MNLKIKNKKFKNQLKTIFKRKPPIMTTTQYQKSQMPNQKEPKPRKKEKALKTLNPKPLYKKRIKMTLISWRKKYKRIKLKSKRKHNRLKIS